MAKFPSSTARAPVLDTAGYGYDDVLPLVETSLRAGLSVLLRGHPGVGKSALAKQVSERLGLPMHDIRLAQREPAELCGVHFPDRDKQVLALFAPQWVREVCDAPGFVFLDEINAAVTRLHQAAAYQIVLERRVGPFRFHPGTVVMAAGNLEEDQAIVSTLSSALNNRFVHFQLKVEPEAWLRWGERSGVHPAVLAYVHAQDRIASGVLYDNTGDDAFPTPRSWEMASRLLLAAGDDDRAGRRLCAACIGAPAAEKFFAHLRIYQRVDARGIVEKGKAVDFSKGKESEASFVAAAVYAIADWLTGAVVADGKLVNVVKFLRSPGLDAEYQFLFLRRLKAASDLTERLKALPEYRELAAELVHLHTGLYR
ncbi:MAG: AAA family ATPase [Myxococcota bacterium]